MSPRWSPDGNTIYFWRGGSAVSLVFSNALDVFERMDSLFAARIMRETRLEVLATDFVLAGQPGWSTRDWDLHPDGDHFVVRRLSGADSATAEDGTAARYLIVTNWFTELLAAMEAEGAGR